VPQEPLRNGVERGRRSCGVAMADDDGVGDDGIRYPQTINDELIELD
jgi:hypothetical protein